MPTTIEVDLDLNLRSLLEYLNHQELGDMISKLARQIWKKDKLIEIIDNTSYISDLKTLGSSVLRKVLDEPQNEKEMEVQTRRWLREEKNCQRVEREIDVAGKIADIVGCCSRLGGRYNSVYAVELKRRTAGIDRAIGQMQRYLFAAHYVYLAISPMTYYRLSDRDYARYYNILDEAGLGLLILNTRGDIRHEILSAERSNKIEQDDFDDLWYRINS